MKPMNVPVRIKKTQKELNDEMIRLNSEWEKVRSSEQLIVWRK